MLEKNLSIIRDRWPSLAIVLNTAKLPDSVELVTNRPETTIRINGIHLSSAYDRKREAQRQAALIPAQSEQAWVYGTGLGDLPRMLLERTSIRQLNVVMLNPSVTLASMTHFDHTDWLADPRVKLLPGDEENLAAPLAANPACLILADIPSASLRDRVFLELATPFINKQHAAGNPEVQARIKANERFVKEDGDVRTLFGTRAGATIMVVAAGPSLTPNLEKIAGHRDRFPLIAVNSALKPLAQAGIVPDVAVVVDPDPKILSCFEGYETDCFADVPLVYFPRVPETVPAVWPGPRFAAYARHASYDDIRKKFPRGVLLSSGSVLHTAVDLAVNMGAAAVILFGADLAFPGGVRYAKGAGWQEEQTRGMQHWVLDGHGKQVETTPALRGYLRDLESYIKTKRGVRFYNSSLDGARIEGTELWEGWS